ncbi:MAG: hypothetical protein U0903_01800 [Planctomycetales bacterium]
MTAPPPSTKPSIVRLGARWGVRGGIAGLVIWLAWWSMQGISALVATPVVENRPASAPITPLEVLREPDLSGGMWQFLDEGGEMDAQILPRKNASSEILASPPQLAALAETAKGSPNPRGDELLRLLKRNGKMRGAGVFQRYHLKQWGHEIVAYTLPKPEERLVLVRLLVPYGTERAWLIDYALQGKPAGSLSAASSPLPEKIPQRLICQRMDGSGKVFSQLFVIEGKLPDLLEGLRQNSWEFDKSPKPDTSEFVTIHLARRSESYWVIVTPLPGGSRLRILLVRDDGSS